MHTVQEQRLKREKAPKKKRTIRSFKYRIYPNKIVTQRLEWTLEECRRLYIAALSDRDASYRSMRVVPIDDNDNPIDFFTYALTQSGDYTRIKIDPGAERVPVGKYVQSRKLTIAKRELRPEWKQITDHVLRDVLDRVDRAYQDFFRRCKKRKEGEKAGYPHFPGKDRFNSFRFPDSSGWKFETFADRPKKANLALSNIGDIKVEFHRPYEGELRQCIIEREVDHWYCVLVCSVEARVLPVSYEDVGLDLGVKVFAAKSDGEFIENPRMYRNSEEKLKDLQRSIANKKNKKSNRRKKIVTQIGRLHRHIRNQRQDFLHKESTKLIKRYQIIALEELSTKKMMRRPKPKLDEQTGQFLPNGASLESGLHKSIADAGWFGFTQMVVYKGKRAGRDVRLVDPANTSQMCSACLQFPCVHCKHAHKDAVQTCQSCGEPRAKELSDRWHSCSCGCELDCDTNAAINVLRLGLTT